MKACDSESNWTQNRMYSQLSVIINTTELSLSHHNISQT